MTSKYIGFFLAVGLVLCSAQPALARRLSADEALGKIKSMDSTPQLKTYSRSGLSDMKLVHTETALKAEPLFYIFSRGENKGMVIASADDRLVSVLGYTDKGTFRNVNDLPPNMKWWLEEYARVISQYYSDSNPETSAIAGYVEVERENIEPLVDAEWGQDYPFNAKTPIIYYEHAPVGCVATTMAMVMRYHRYPEYGTGTKSYSIKTVSEPIFFDFGATRFDYDNMPGYLDEDWDDEKIDAVATLNFACGVATEMEYTDTGAGTDLMDEPFITYFNYPDKGLGRIPRTYFDIDEWETMVYTELAEGRPVIYRGDGGSTSGAGHAFLCDGYQDGLFHINWGWYGDYDGYYSLSILRPDGGGTGSNGSDTYSLGQQIIRGLRPPKAKAATPMFVAGNFFYTEETETFRYNNLISKTHHRYFHPGIKAISKESGQETFVNSTDGNYMDIVDVSMGNRYQKTIDFQADFSTLADGEYELRPFFRLAEDDVDNPDKHTDWLPVYVNLTQNRYFTVEIKDGKILSASGGTDTDYDVWFDNFKAKNTLIANDNVAFTIDGYNNGNVLISAVYKKIFDAETGELVSTNNGREAVVLEPGTSGTFNMGINTEVKKAGNYELQIFDSNDGTIPFSDRIPFKLYDKNDARIIDGYKYIILSEEDRTVEVLSNSYKNTVIDIPQTVTIDGKEYTVVEMGNVFSMSNTNLTTLSLPQTLAKMGGSSFYGCTNLSSVTMPDCMEQLGGSTFRNCTALTTIKIPSGLKEINTCTFLLSGLTDVEIPDGVTYIGTYAFSQTKLSKIMLPASIESIDDNAFAGTNLTQVFCNAVIPPTICEYTFYTNTIRNGSLFVPAESVERYRNAKFWGDFKNIYAISDDKYVQKDGLWYELTSKFEAIVIPPVEGGEYELAKVTIPGTINHEGVDYKVIEIADNAFRNVTALTTLSLTGASNLTRIGDRSFENTSITGLGLPTSLKEIGDYAFSCTQMKTIGKFPTTLQKIGDHAFAENRLLTGVSSTASPGYAIIPESVVEIGEGVFKNCSSLTILKIESKAIPGDGFMEGCESLLTLLLGEGLPSEAIEIIKNDLPKSCSYYIDASTRDYYLPMFNGGETLYDLLEAPSVVEGEPVVVSDVTEITLKFNNVNGNPRIKEILLLQLVGAKLVDFAVGNVEDYATYFEDGTVKLTITPVMVTANAVAGIIRFEQPDLSMNLSIHVTDVPVPITAIEFEEDELSLSTGDEVTLTPIVTPEDAPKSSLSWSSSVTSVATVDNWGRVKALKAGETVITCRALTSDAQATCLIKVAEPSLQSITLSVDSEKVKAGTTVKILVEIEPAVLSGLELEWTTSDSSVATIDENGLLTAHTPGEVAVKASPKGLDTLVEGSLVVSVVAPVPGKAIEDGNDIVAIEDVTAISNYLLGVEHELFNKVAADANLDGAITISDVTTAVKILLEQPVGAAVAYASTLYGNADNGVLKLGTIVFNKAGQAVLDVELSTEYDYVGLQADFRLPDGVSVKEVTTMESASDHSLLWKQRDDGTVRVVMLSLSGTVIPAGDTIFQMVLEGSPVDNEGVSACNVRCSDSGATGYSLSATGGDNETTGIGALDANVGVEITYSDGYVRLHNYDGLSEVELYNLAGLKLYSGFNDVIPVSYRGIIIVKVGPFVRKIAAQ